jgi:hypothetical protein
MEELYQGEEITSIEKYLENEIDVELDFKGPEILKSEFNKSLKELANNKATGIDSIPIEILRNTGEKTEDQVFKITN